MHLIYPFLPEINASVKECQYNTTLINMEAKPDCLILCMRDH